MQPRCALPPLLHDDFSNDRAARMVLPKIPTPELQRRKIGIRCEVPTLKRPDAMINVVVIVRVPAKIFVLAGRAHPQIIDMTAWTVLTIDAAGELKIYTVQLVGNRRDHRFKDTTVLRTIEIQGALVAWRRGTPIFESH